MLGTLKIMTDYVERRRLIASYEAEMIARSREQLARSEVLLRAPIPSLFLGNHTFIPCPKLQEPTSPS